MPAEIDIVCVQCEKLGPLDETWQTTGQMDEIGRLLGLCADCQPRDAGEEGAADAR